MNLLSLLLICSLLFLTLNAQTSTNDQTTINNQTTQTSPTVIQNWPCSDFHCASCPIDNTTCEICIDNYLLINNTCILMVLTELSKDTLSSVVNSLINTAEAFLTEAPVVTSNSTSNQVDSQTIPCSDHKTRICNEALNRWGPNGCASDADCYLGRTCEFWGWCTGTAKTP